VNEILQVFNATLSYASVALLTVIVGLLYLLLTYPALIGWSTVTVLAWWLIRRNARLRRMWCWHVWYPIQRSIHALTVPARRRMVGFLMCKVKKSVLADIIDTALRDAIDSRHITYHEYRELCAKIGEALEVSDLIPKGKRWRHVTRMIVEKNCAETRRSGPISKIPGAPEPAIPGHQELRYLRNRNAA
jgi:hypothetical protein